MASTKTVRVATPAPFGKLPDGRTVCAYCGNDLAVSADTPYHEGTGEAKCKNTSRKEVRAYGHDQAWARENAYEVWEAPGWVWYVLAKRQTDSTETYAIWLCACVSPYETDMAGHDTYAREVMSNARRVK